MEFCRILYLNKLITQAAVVIVCYAMCHNSMALDSRVFFDTQSLSYSDVAPIKQFSNSLHGPAVNNGKVAFSTSNISCGQSFKLASHSGAFQYAIFYRMDYSLTFSPDTAILVHANENDIPLDPNRIYKIQLKANHISARGLSLNYSRSLFENIYFDIGLSYLYANNMIYGALSGDLSSLESDANGHINVDYFYTEDVLFDRKKNDYSANGYALDFSLKWTYSKKIDIEFEGKDLISHIYWRHQDQTLAEASTDRIGVDALGRIQVNAALTWQELNADVNQKLPQQLLFKESYHLTQKDTLALEHFSYDGTVFHRLGYRRFIMGQNSIYAYFDVSTKAIGVNVDVNFLKLGVFTDNIQFDKAKMFGVTLSLHAPLHL